MLNQLGRRVTYANVMSTIAVFAVLAGGGAYAASKIGPGDIAKNAVRAKHVKKKQVRAKHIRNGAVTKPKLANGSVNSAKVENRSLRATDYSVFNGTEDVDLGSIPAHSCTTSILSVPGIRATDVTIVPTPSEFSGVGPQHVTISGVSGMADSLRWRNCNVSNAAVDPPPTTFSYIVLRP